MPGSPGWWEQVRQTWGSETKRQAALGRVDPREP